MRNMILVLTVLVLLSGILGISGCATATSHLGYHRFYQSKGEYRLVQRNNDIWIDKLDGSESRQITHTPRIAEIEAQFSVDGKHVVYETQDLVFISPIFKFYRVPIDKDDGEREEISKQEAQSLAPSLFYP